MLNWLFKYYVTALRWGSAPPPGKCGVLVWGPPLGSEVRPPQGPRDASVVRSARAKACHHRRCQSDARGRLTPSVPRPIPQRQLKKKSTTSPCLEMVGYVVTARNPVPPISLFLPDLKGSLRFAPGFHPTRTLCAIRFRRPDKKAGARWPVPESPGRVKT